MNKFKGLVRSLLRPGILTRLVAYPAIFFATLWYCDYLVKVDMTMSQIRYEAGRFLDQHPEYLSFEPTTVLGQTNFSWVVSTNLSGNTAVYLHNSGSKVAAGRIAARTSVYGYLVQGDLPCFLQFYDAAPGTAITVGTDVPVSSLPSMTNSSNQLYQPPDGRPLFTVGSGLAVVLTTTPDGNTACAGGTHPFTVRLSSAN